MGRGVYIANFSGTVFGGGGGNNQRGGDGGGKKPNQRGGDDGGKKPNQGGGGGNSVSTKRVWLCEWMNVFLTL